MKTKPLNWKNLGDRLKAASNTGVVYSVRRFTMQDSRTPYELQVFTAARLEPVVSYHATLAEAKQAAQDDLTAKVEADLEKEDRP